MSNSNFNREVAEAVAQVMKGWVERETGNTWELTVAPSATIAGLGTRVMLTKKIQRPDLVTHVVIGAEVVGPYVHFGYRMDRGATYGIDYNRLIADYIWVGEDDRWEPRTSVLRAQLEVWRSRNHIAEIFMLARNFGA